jgi:hypothetical protein
MTALVIHPNTGYNTFTDVAGADTIADDFLDVELWTSLTPTQKQRWLLYTGTMIINLKGIELPDTAVDCLAKAQVMIILNMLKFNLLSAEGTQQVRMDYFNKMSIEYFKNNNLDNTIREDIPAGAWSCLVSVGADKPSSIGNVGVFRRTR